MKLHTNRGGALVTAIILSAVILSGLAAMVRYTLNHRKDTLRNTLTVKAFHAAEAGLEAVAHRLSDGTYAVANGTSKIFSSPAGETTWRVRATRNDTKTGSIESEIYTLRSLGTASHASFKLSADQVVEITYTRNFETSGGPGDPQTTTNPVTPPPPREISPGLLTKEIMNLNHAGNSELSKPHFKTYDSLIGRPSDTNQGRDAFIATTSTAPGALKLNISNIQGSVATGGGEPSYTKGQTDAWNNATLQNTSTDKTASGKQLNFDTGLISTNFTHTFVKPTDPLPPTSTSGWTKITPDQNTFNNGGYRNQTNLVLGETGKKTYVKFPDDPGATNLTIKGEVVFVLGQNLNIGGNIVLEDGAKLDLYVGANVNINGSTKTQNLAGNKVVDATYAPERLKIHGTGSTSQSITITGNWKTFSGVINAPDAKVNIHGTQNANSIDSLPSFLGSVIAREMEATNAVQFWFDVRGTSTREEPPTDVVVDEKPTEAPKRTLKDQGTSNWRQLHAATTAPAIREAK